MRLFSVIIISVCIISACATPETLSEADPAETVEESAVPQWFSNDVYSHSDSVAVYGFAMASAADSAHAATYSKESSVQNLKFEIDRLAEDARRELAAVSESPYSDTAFIINLRTVIRDLSLEGADFTVEHEVSESGIHYIYSKAVVSRENIITLLQHNLHDEALLQKLAP